jgi:hypothetical protein
MKTLQFWKYVNSNRMGMPVTVTCSDSDDTVTARMLKNKIIVDVTQLSNMATATLNTPVRMKITDVYAISTQDEADDSITVKNNTSDITDVLQPAADKTFARASAIDDAYWEFDVDDDDLVLKAGEETICIFNVTITDGDTSDTGEITGIGGLTKAVTWDTDASTTAGNFVTSHATAYSGEDITLTSDGAKLIFTSDNVNVQLDTPVFTADDPTYDLAATVEDVTPVFKGRVVMKVSLP